MLERPEVELVKLLVGLAATFLLLLDAADRPGPRGRARRLRALALGVLATVGALCWWNLGLFHYPGFVQGHEFYHYYLGGKYFPELGYTRLYDCTALADAEVLPRRQLAMLPLRNLETNRIGRVQDALSSPEACTDAFTPERWEEFRRDVGWFRERLGARSWLRLKVDHGFNAPPTWTLLGTPVANRLGVSQSGVAAASLIDPLLQLVLWSGVAWVFGWRVLAIGLVFWGTNGLGEFAFVGGAYLRQDWLAAAVLGLCALRRERHATAGFLLATSALLRLFPAFLLAALGVNALALMWRRRSWRPPREAVRVAAGALLAVAVLVPLSGLTSGGLDRWPQFVTNIREHARTPLLNHVGLRTVAAFHPANAMPVRESEAELQRWERMRAGVEEDRRWLVVAVAALYGVLLLRAAGRAPDWVVAILGIGGLVVALELTAYYYAVLIAYALLHERDRFVAPALCALATFTTVSSSYLLRMDLAHAASSVGVVLFVLWCTWRAGRRSAHP